MRVSSGFCFVPSIELKVEPEQAPSRKHVLEANEKMPRDKEQFHKVFLLVERLSNLKHRIKW